MKNGNKNGVVGPGNPPEEHQFTSENQPSPEAKSRGWDRRRTKQEIMDLITDLRGLSMRELEELKEDIKNNPDKHTVLEAKMVQYLSKEKFTIDFLDRNVGKAPQDIDITSNGSDITGVEVKIVDSKDEITDTSNKGVQEDNSSRETS
jgi:hypothetical protein